MTSLDLASPTLPGPLDRVTSLALLRGTRRRLQLTQDVPERDCIHRQGACNVACLLERAQQLGLPVHLKMQPRKQHIQRFLPAGKGAGPGESRGPRQVQKEVLPNTVE